MTCYYKLCNYFQFVILISLGSYVTLLYWYKKLEYFFNFGMLTLSGFVISFLFFEYYVINFTGNQDSLTISLKMLLKNSDSPCPKSELQFLLTREALKDFLLFLARFETVEFTDSSNRKALRFAY